MGREWMLWIISMHKVIRRNVREKIRYFNSKSIRIAGDDYPAELVKAKFMKLNSSHIEFALDCMRENTTKIRNIKQYLRVVLFNAPSTINNYYTALVAHDMASGKI